VIGNHESIDVFIGLDVGKGEHHAVAVDRAGKKLFDKALPNDEARLREVLASLNRHGSILLVVDQPATIGALPVAVAQAAGATVGYLPGLAMRRIADLHPGEAKTDARDAFMIAEAARTMPHTLRSIQVADEQLAELTMLCGFDDDLAKQATATSNRIRGLLTQNPPGTRARPRPPSGPPCRVGFAADLADSRSLAPRRPAADREQAQEARTQDG
jgi:transposase